MKRQAMLLVAAVLALFAPVVCGNEPKTAAKRPANRLAKETSPYLLLHAHNPVDWHPWGEEALEKAKRERKPIFLSIGYSSCYWCHVMERESFMDDEIAAILNKHFVCIKVDREERPDLDEIYMRSLDVYFKLTGSSQRGGWPLSMFLTPDAKPLTGGTYFPPRDRDGRTGFLTIVGRVAEAWGKDPDKWQLAGNQIAEIVKDSLRQRPALGLVKADQEMVDAIYSGLHEDFDREYGGFGYTPENPQRPKFPEPPNLVFLLQHARHGKQADEARSMLEQTLAKMAAGGIRDHVGGGFHRYSTDRFWRVPHFEKMLYDNGQLASVYSEAYELTKSEAYKPVVDELIAFVFRELRDKDGAFYTALDAETESEEGKFYVWDPAEIKKSLTPEEFALTSDVYGLRGEANFEGRFILIPSGSPAGQKVTRDQLAEIHTKLLAVRNQRPCPLTDTKILTSSNGLMIKGLADAGRIFKNPQYTEAAAKAADFVLTKMRTPQGRLCRCCTAGQLKTQAFLDDYAFFVGGLLALHKATGDERWLRTADDLTKQQIELFWDETGGGFFYTAKDHEELIARSKVPSDSAVPSGNSQSAANLLHLAKALIKPAYRQQAEATINSSATMMKQYPLAAPQMGAALAEFLRTQ